MTSDLTSDQTSTVDPGAADRVCRSAQILMVVIATMLHAVFLVHSKPLQSANDRSRWCTVWSLVERGTFQIDEIRQRPGWDTIDLVRVDGHFYSTKPPLLTSIVAGITWCLQRLTGWTLIDHPQELTVLVLLIVNLIPFVISLIVWIGILDRLTDQPQTRLFGLSIAAFATLLTPFLMTLNNHTVAAASTTFALYGLVRIITDKPGAASGWPFALCGFASSFAAANELPAGLLPLLTFVLALRHSVRRAVMYFLPAAIVPLLALVISNVIATGSWKPVYADYGTDKYRFVVDGVPSYWMEPHGVDRNLDSPVMYFVHCMIGHHGLFSLSPIALFAIAGWMMGLRVHDRSLKTLLWLGVLTGSVVIAFYMTRTQNYNFGGVSCALRWALWLTPFWIVALIPVLDRFGSSGKFRILTAGLAMVSMYSAWQPIGNPWQQPWLFGWMESRGWIDYSDPPVELERPLWTWFSKLSFPVDGEPPWIEFHVTQPGLEPRFVRLISRPDSNGRPGERISLEVRESWGASGPADRIRTIQIKAEPFQNGEPPAEFVTWSDADVTPQRQQADLAFVRGLPRKVPYRARAIRYLKTPLRPDAFKCQQVAAHVSYSADEQSKPLNYRCDAWLNDEVPFGVAQVEFHMSDPETGSTLFHERWTVRDCWPKVQHAQ